MTSLENKVAVITGGARGQGRSHAIKLAEQGADIVVVDVCHDIPTVTYPMARAHDLEETVKMVEALGRRAVCLEGDVRDSNDMSKTADLAMSEFGRIDILLANAGIHGMHNSVWEIDDESWHTMIDVNLTGVWKACKAVIPHIISGKNGGSIVITSSVDGLRAAPSWGHYGAAKGGLQTLMKTLAFELASENIRVNTVNPTGVNSPMADGLAPNVMKYIERWSANTDRANLLDVHLVEVEDITNAVLWLVSDSARYVTGIDLPVDAGYSNKH